MMFVRDGVRLVLSLTVILGGASVTRAGLSEYLKAADSSYRLDPIESRKTPAGTVHHFSLTSQTWQGIAWKHRLQIYEPKNYTHKDTVLLFITGGGKDSVPGIEDETTGFMLAKLCDARCAILPQVPNQPLLGNKTEDTLIAETFVRFLETKDENWPLLFPMVKSAVRAMDAIESWSREEGREPARRFVTTGASKRGWTTWLTASQDPRVIAIAPMVIDTLNMRKQNEHVMEIWGKPSEQIEDYEKRGLLSTEETPERLRLWKMVDPYTYRDQLKLPKLIINGANDRYWALDALNLYWDGLEGPKWVVYVPNAGHSLETNRTYATHGIGAIFRHAATGRAVPKVSWKHDDDDGALRLTVESSPRPVSARVWTTTARTLDFRESRWTDTPMNREGDRLIGRFQAPADDCAAIFGDLEFEIDGLKYHLSTQVRHVKASKK